MERELQVPLVQQDLPPAETYAQLCNSLTALYTVADVVLTRIHDRVTEETGRIQELSQRLQAAEDAIAELAEEPGRVALAVPARLPAPSALSTWRPLFSRHAAASREGNSGASDTRGVDAGGASALAAEEQLKDPAEGRPAGVAQGPQVAGRETADLYHTFKQAQQLSYTAELQGGPAGFVGVESLASVVLFGSDETTFSSQQEDFGLPLTRGLSSTAPFDMRSLASVSTLPESIPPELQSDYAPHAGGGGERLGFLPGTRPIPAINLPPTLPDLEHFAASSAMSGRSFSRHSRSAPRGSTPSQPRAASTLADTANPAWQLRSAPELQHVQHSQPSSSAPRSEPAAAPVQPRMLPQLSSHASGGGGHGSAAPEPDWSASQTRVPPLRLSGLNPASAASLPPLSTAAAAIVQRAGQDGAAPGGIAPGSGQPAADKRIPGSSLSRASSGLGSPPDDSRVLGLQRSISHRQLSLGRRLSFDAVPAPPDQLPRLPGQQDGSSGDSMSLRSFLQQKDAAPAGT